MYWEEFEPGRVMTTAARAVSGEDLDLFIKLSGLDNPLFTSGAEIGGGARIVPAPLQLSLGMGLCQRAGIFDHVVAVLQFDDMKFLQVARLGDSLRLEAAVELKRPAKRADRGVVVLGYTLFNQHDRAVMTAKAWYLMRRSPPAAQQ
ncbi:MAG: hypothetical protein V1816_18065 [Pseudomonadota bacterium]